MKRNLKLLAAASVTGVALAGMSVSPAFAWHPVGKIQKYVQNQTTGSQMVDANAGSALSTKPGDTLIYTIEVRNDGEPDAKGYNDMANTVMTDTLPAGVELVSNPAQRTITENLDLIQPGQKKTKMYTVVVTSKTDGLIIENKACFTGNSTKGDAPQKGCDVANIKVNVPVVTPPKPETPAPPKAPVPVEPQPATLPVTGASDFVLPSIVAAAAGYGLYLLRLKRKTVAQEN